MLSAPGITSRSPAGTTGGAAVPAGRGSAAIAAAMPASNINIPHALLTPDAIALPDPMVHLAYPVRERAQTALPVEKI
jgi:hypothetical protein